MRQEAAVDWVARAAALRSLISDAAPQADSGALPAAVDEALHECGLYRILIPRSCGGAELDPLTYADVLETLASIDGSTAWCVGQVTACNMSAAYLDLPIAREIFGAPRAMLAWGPPAGGSTPRADVVDGGYRVTATWEFASGSRQANWLGGMLAVFERDGKQRMNPDGRPEVRTVLFPKSSATITDIWQVVGLRGTGSDRYAIADLFIPDEHTFTRDRGGWREAGPLYRHSMVYLHAIAFAAVALGLGRATLDAFIELAKHKRPTRGSFGQPLRQNNAVQYRIGLAEAQLRGARAYLHAATRAGWEEAQTMTADDGLIGMGARIEMRAACTYAIEQAEKVVDVAYRMAGATAIFDRQPFERRFRDMHAVTQQAQGHLANYEIVGQYALGEPFDLMM
jgi:alkylation response protein AidB-like acyl-CoA dehydrogenase